MSAPTLSVLMCVYNHAAYVGEALEAILSQSCPPLEIVVIDDGSTDGGAEVIARYAEREPRLRFYRNERNQGLFAAVERGLGLVRGDFVYGAAADDRALPGLFEKSMALLARHPEAGLCSARSAVIGAAGEPLGELWVPAVAGQPVYLPPAEALAALDRKRSWFTGPTVIYRREALRAAGGFRPELGSFCDGFVYLVLAAKHGVCFIPEVLAAWRRTDQNFSLKIRSDPGLALDIMDRVGVLMRTTYAGLFPPGFATRWERQWFLDVLDDVTGRRRDVARLCAARVPARTARDRAYFGFLQAALAGISLVTKLYALSRASFSDQSRIARNKVGIGGGSGDGVRR
jgi:glycosyltransferase involved in cell wall biosynthesis